MLGMSDDKLQQQLFREEARSFASQRSLGQVTATQPLTYKSITALLVVIACSAFSYVWIGEYSRKQTVTGYLTPDKGLVNVYPGKDGAVINHIYVHEGQIIKQGDPLVSVSYPSKLPGDDDVLGTVLVEMNLQQGQVQQKLSRLKQNHQHEQLRVKRQIEEQVVDLAQTHVAHRLQLGQVEVAVKLHSSMQALRETGAISEFRQLQALSEKLEQEKQLSHINRRVLQIQAATRSLEYEQKKLPASQQDQLLSTQIQLSAIKQKIVELRARQSKLITSSVNGRVTALQAKVGASTQSWVSLLSLIPSGSLLECSLLIPSAAIAFVEVGQSVRLLFDAYPHQQYGSHAARVTSVSAVPVDPRALTAPLRPDGPVFLVRAVLDKQTISAMGEERRLQAGMLLKADIIFEKRTLLNWLLEPLYSLRGR